MSSYKQGQKFYIRCEACGYLEQVLPDTLARAKWLAYCHQSEIQSTPCEESCGYVRRELVPKHVVHVEEIVPVVLKEYAVLPPCIRYLPDDRERIQAWFEEHDVRPA